MPARVVVLGGGYAGVACVRRLQSRAGRDLQVTLVDRNPFHTLLTETHTVAAGTRPVSTVALPFDFGPQVRRLEAEVTAIHPEGRWVETTAGSLEYDYLVFALGGADQDYGIPGVREHALFLRGIDDARRIRAALAALPRQAPVVIVGGGLTGVELAAEIALSRPGGSLTVVEGAPTLLPSLHPGLALRARRRLGWLGVNVRTGSPVRAVGPDRVELADGTVLPHRLLIWVAGVKGHPLTAQLKVRRDRAGRVEVDAYLRSSRPEIYVIGDSAAFRPAPDARPLAPSGQLSEQMGFAAADDLLSRLEGGPGVPFRPHFRGVLLDLGGLAAAGLIYRLQVAGPVAHLAKRAAVAGHVARTLGLRSLFRLLTGRGLPVGSTPGPQPAAPAGPRVHGEAGRRENTRVEEAAPDTAGGKARWTAQGTDASQTAPNTAAMAGGPAAGAELPGEAGFPGSPADPGSAGFPPP